MSKAGPSAARAVTVAATILACLLVTAGYTMPAYGQQSAETSTPPAGVDSPEDDDAPDPAPDDEGNADDGEAVAGEAPSEPAAPPEREYEPEPEPTSQPSPSPEREYEPEPEPTPTPEPTPAPEPTPTQTLKPEPDAESSPDSPEGAEGDDGQPVGVAGSSPPSAFVPEEPPAEPAPAPEGDSGGAAASAGSGPGRAAGPGLNSSLRSSSAEPYLDGVQAPLVAPREVARADGARGSRRDGAPSDGLSIADRELLASAGPLLSDAATLTVGGEAPFWPARLASALLLVMATLVGRTYAGQRGRAGATDAPGA